MTGSVNIHEGTIWTLIRHGVNMSTKFLGNLVLTRLLTPDVFGIAAIGNTLMSGINMFSDLGIRQNLICSNRSDDAYFQTAWTIQLLRSFCLTAIIALLARPFAMLYGIDSLAQFLFIVAVSNLTMGFNNIEALRAYRHAQLRKITLIDISATLIGVGTMVIWAWQSPSIVALAVGAVLTTTVFMIGSCVSYQRHNYRLRFEREAVADLVGFGKWILLSTVLAFATTQMDRLALGKLVAMEVLGFYSIAWMWASLPNLLLDQWGASVFFPLASQSHRNEGNDRTIWAVRRVFVSLIGFASVVVYAVSDILVAVLYTANYAGVAPLIRQLVIVTMLYSIEQTYSHLLIARGRPKDKIVGQALSVALFAVLLVPVFDRAGIAGVTGLLAMSAVARIAWQAYKLRTAALRGAAFDLAVGVGFGLAAPAMHAALDAFESRSYQVGAAATAGVVAATLALLAYRSVKRICDAK